MSGSEPFALDRQRKLDRLRETAARCFDLAPDQLTDDTSLIEDLGADSIDVLAFIIELESSFGVVLPDDAASHIVRISDALPYVESNSPRRLARNSTPARPLLNENCEHKPLPHDSEKPPAVGATSLFGLRPQV